MAILPPEMGAILDLSIPSPPRWHRSRAGLAAVVSGSFVALGLSLAWHPRVTPSGACRACIPVRAATGAAAPRFLSPPDAEVLQIVSSLLVVQLAIHPLDED